MTDGAASLLARADATLDRIDRLLAPGADIDGAPAVLTETWFPLTFHADGRVELGDPRQGPAASDQRFPPVTVRITEDQLDALFVALWL